ncbi:type VII secretion target [Kitasatospora sp. NPDC058190]|uniref:type VII secretion target n=1 Tax=Kitasatospora sp. NPDC058190 TaxID=3346371 RepID=UPI0036D8EFCE
MSLMGEDQQVGDKPVGYTVQPDVLDGVAGALGQVATDLASANQSYTAQKPYVSTDFGEFGMDQAWSGFDSNWSQELHVTQRAVEELVQKVSATTANYRAVEAKLSKSMTPGGDR